MKEKEKLKYLVKFQDFQFQLINYWLNFFNYKMVKLYSWKLQPQKAPKLTSVKCPIITKSWFSSRKVFDILSDYDLFFRHTRHLKKYDERYLHIIYNNLKYIYIFF